MAKIIVALYDHLDEARQAVDALVENGYTHTNISLVAGNSAGDWGKYLAGSANRAGNEGAATGAGLGAVLGGLGGLLASLGVLAIPGIGPVLAAGPLAAALAGAGVGAAAGGLFGALVDLGLPKEQAELYADAVRRGGTLLTVSASENTVDETVAILNRFNPVDVNPKVETWQAEAAGSRQDIRPGDAQPMNLETESGVPFSEIKPDQGDFSRGENVNPGDDFHRLEEGGAVIAAVSGHTALPPDEHEPQITMRDADQESQRATEDYPRGSSPAAGYSSLDQSGSGLEFYEPVFRRHFEATYSSHGRDYAGLRPAYIYGYTLARDPHYSGRSWEEVEPDASHIWEREFAAGSWEDFKEAVRSGWEAVSR